MRYPLHFSIITAVAFAAAFFSCTMTNHKKKDPAGTVPPPGKRLVESELNTGADVAEYAQFCKQELELPEEVLDPWYCLEGLEIPITINGKQPTVEQYDKMKKNNDGCDLPSWLGEEPCANYAFVQERTLSPDVKAILLCRMRKYTNPLTLAERKSLYESSGTDENFRSLYQFDSIGLIWANTKNGNTCYFDYVGESFGGYVPSPDDLNVPTWDRLPDPKPPITYKTDSALSSFWEKSAATTWKTPLEVAESDNCVRCHDGGPFKASPWIGQVYSAPRNSPAVPQIVVGKVFDIWKKRFPMVAVSTQPIKNEKGESEEQICTSCHRIGSQATCRNFLSFSTGKSSPVDLSERGKSFFYRTWMPPPPEEWHGKLESELVDLWNEKYERHVARMQCCCDNPKAKGCLTQEFGQSPIPNYEAGKGPGLCP